MRQRASKPERRGRQRRSSRPTRDPSVERLVDAAHRALAFYSRVTESETVRVLSEIPSTPHLGGRLIRESMQTVKVAVGDAIYNLINQDLLYRVPLNGAVPAFKNGFFNETPGISIRFTVRAFERDGVWEPGGPLPFVDPTVEEYIVEASDVKIGTAYPGVAPVTCYLLVDRSTLLEGPDSCSVVIHFLNPYNHDGCHPPYVDSFGRYSIVDHGDGTATVKGYWLGNPGTELMEPMLRETKAVKVLHSLFEDLTNLLASNPLGKLAALPLVLVGRVMGLVASIFAKVGDFSLGITGLRGVVWRLLADRHIVFYEREWCNPDRWLHGGSDSDEKVGDAPSARLGPAASTNWSAQEYADRVWRELRQTTTEQQSRMMLNEPLAARSQVVGTLEEVYVQDDGVWARIRYTGTTPDEVQRLFLEEDPSEFAAPASTFFRRRTPTGQSCLESPLGGPPIMYTTFAAAPAPVGETLVVIRGVGVMKGGGTIRCYRRGDDTIVEEQNMVGHLDLRAVPLVGQVYAIAEWLPWVGRLLRRLRERWEFLLGKRTAEVHAKMVRTRSVDAIAVALNRRQGRATV
jgi:hypothetical protein